jgi:carbon storage regulator CsrA
MKGTHKLGLDGAILDLAKEEGLSMLVLTRKSNEAVMVGGSCSFERVLKVTVLEIGAGKVRLGFEVDKEVPVHRWEVWERLRATGRPDSPAEGPVGADESVRTFFTDRS